MKDRTGVRVCKGDRVLVFRTSGTSRLPHERLGYDVISSIARCDCVRCDGKQVAIFSTPNQTDMSCASSDEMELPVTAAIARLRESETRCGYLNRGART